MILAVFSVPAERGSSVWADSVEGGVTGAGALAGSDVGVGELEVCVQAAVAKSRNMLKDNNGWRGLVHLNIARRKVL